MRTLVTPRGRCHGGNDEHLRRGAGSGSPLSFLAQDSQTLVRTYVVGLRFSASNPRLLIGWQTHAINSHPALLLLFGGIHACELSQAIRGHEDVAVIKEATTLWNHKKGDFALPGTRRVNNGCASHAWAHNGRVVALVLRLFLRHVLAFLCLPVPPRAGAMASSGVRVDPNSYVGVATQEATRRDRRAALNYALRRRTGISLAQTFILFCNKFRNGRSS